MPYSNVILPKQQRSQDTQEKLLAALHVCLDKKFFEHISIKELADEANVSVGTFYRRFKNKESLLPLLYQEFGNDLHNWVVAMEARSFDSLSDCVYQMCQQTRLFLESKQAVFRTLHLNSRLHSTILNSDSNVDRRQIYVRIANILLRFKNSAGNEIARSHADVVVFTIIASLLDKVLYHNLTPAIACQLSSKDYTDQLAAMLLGYLQNP